MSAAAQHPRADFAQAQEVLVTPEQLSFRLEGDGTRIVPCSALTEIRIRTTAGGADLVWELRAGEAEPPLSIASGPNDNELMDGFSKRLRGVDLDAMTAGMAATTEGSFLVWRR